MKIAVAAMLAATALAMPNAEAHEDAHGPVVGCWSYLATGRPHQAIRDTVTILTTHGGTANVTNLTPQGFSDALASKSLELARPAIAPHAYRPNRVESCELERIDGQRTLVLTTRSLSVWHLTQPRLTR